VQKGNNINLHRIPPHLYSINMGEEGSMEAS